MKIGNGTKMDHDNKKTARAAVVNTIANIIALAIGLIMVPIISRVIPADDLGVASIFVSTRNCLTIIGFLAVYDYLYKAMLEYPRNKKEYILSILVFITLMTIGLFIMVLPFREYVKSLFSMDDFLFYWLFVSAFVYAVGQIGHHYCVFHNRYILILLIVLATGPVSQILGVILAAAMPMHKYIGRVIGLDFYSAAITISLLLWLMFSIVKERHIKPDIKYVKNTLFFSIPIVPHLLSQMLLTQSDLIMIGKLADSEKSGIYSMAHTVGNLAYTVLLQVITVWSPWVYRRLEEKEEDQVFRNSKFMICIGSYLSIGLLTVSTEVIKLFLTETYLPCIYIVPPLVCSMFFQFAYIFTYDLNYYNKRPAYIAIPSIVAAIANIVLNLALIPEFGFMVACYTTLVSYAILFGLSFLFSIRLGVMRIYNVRYLIGAVFVVLLYAVVMMTLAEFIIIRYLLLLVITVILLATQYNKVIGMMRMVRKK